MINFFEINKEFILRIKVNVINIAIITFIIINKYDIINNIDFKILNE